MWTFTLRVCTHDDLLCLVLLLVVWQVVMCGTIGYALAIMVAMAFEAMIMMMKRNG